MSHQALDMEDPRQENCQRPGAMIEIRPQACGSSCQCLEGDDYLDTV